MLDDMLNTPPDADYEPVGFDQFGYPVDPTGTQPPVVINVKNLNVTQNLGGAPIYNYTMPYSTKSRMLTLLLAIFLGFFGAHCFYAGRVGRGLLYFFTIGLFGLGWLWDIIAVALGRFTDGYGFYIVNW